jgi:O-antigen/teichoic acid export membrane protein
LNKHLPPKKPVGVRRRDVQTLLGFSLPLWLSDLMINFRDNIQTILLGSLSTIANVGIYSIVSQVNMIGQMLLGSIIASAKPMIAELHDRGDDPQLSRLYQTTTKWLLMINLPVFLVMVLFPKQILSIFGNSFINGAGALVVLAFANLVNIGTGMCGAIIEMTGYTKLKLVNTFVRLITSVSFNFLLIPIWGIIGAAVAALLVEIIVNFLILFQIWFLFRMFPYNKHFFNLLVAGIAAFAATLIVNHFLPNQENLLYFLIGLAVMFGVYVGVSLVLGLAPEDRLLLSRLQKRVSSLVG